MYSEWANGQVEKVKGILNAAREDHTTAVKKRIDNVKQLGSVIEVTKQLFELSKVCYAFSPNLIKLSTLSLTIWEGDRSAGGESFRARTEDCSGVSSEASARFLGAV